MNYIKHATPFLSYPRKYHQIFLHSPKKAINKANIIALYVDEKIDDDDVYLLEFMWKAVYSTKEQIRRFALAHNIEYFDERLKNLFENYLCHKFFLCEEKKPEGQAPADAEMIYCLSEGGSYIIENYCDDFIIWGIDKICMTSHIIAKTLFETEFSLNVMFGTSNIDKVYYKKHPNFYILKAGLTLAAQYRFQNKEDVFYILTDVISSLDDILTVRQRLRQFHSVFAKGIWRKYYPDTTEIPILVLLVETDEYALQLAKEIEETTDINPNQYYFITNERLKNDIRNDDTFLCYDKNNNVLCPTSIDILKK